MKKKRLYRIKGMALAVVMLFSAFTLSQPYVAWARDGETQEIPEDYTPIDSVEGLYAINNDPTGNYILTADIDLSETKQGGELDAGSGWKPLDSFSGTFDGNGHYISNMSINQDENVVQFNIGLFSVVEGTVKNLGLRNVDIHAVLDTGFGLDADYSIGGIVGELGDEGHISQCFVTGQIDIYNTDYISAYVGGIVGYGFNQTFGDTGIIEDCYSDVELSTDSEEEDGRWAGSICGRDGELKNCYSIGITTGAKPSDGINCYYPSTIGTGSGALTLAQMKMQGSYNGFNFNDIWFLDKNSTYPYPQLRSCMQTRIEYVELGDEPQKLDYLTTDSALELTGATIRIKYEGRDEIIVPMTEDMLTYSLSSGTQSVIVSYGGCSTSFDINVSKEKPVLSVKDTMDIEVDRALMLAVDYTGDGKISYTTDSHLIKVTSTGRITTLSPGTATVVIEASETDKYQAASKAVTINVLKKSATIKLSKSTLNRKALKKNAQTIRITCDSAGKLSAKNMTSGKKKGYVKISKKMITLKKDAPGGTYKIKVIVEEKGVFKKTMKVLKIKVK